MPDSFTHLHCTPSSRCSTARRGSATSWPRPPPTASRRSASPTTATCTASSTSTRRAKKQGVKPIIGTELYQAYEHRTERPARRGRMDDSGGDAEGGRKAYYHLTALAENNVGLQEPDPALEPGLPRGLLHEAQGRLGAARGPPRGHHRHHRLPRRAGAAGAACRATRRARSRRRPGSRTSSAGQPLRRDPGPRHPRAAPHQPAAARDRPQDRRPAARHQRQPLHPPARRRGPRRPAVRADRAR